jgi:hypothetical protein
MVKYINTQQQQEKSDKENKRRWEIENKRAEENQQEAFLNNRVTRATNAIERANAIDARNEFLTSKRKKTKTQGALAKGMAGAVGEGSLSPTSNMAFLRGLLSTRPQTAAPVAA